MASQHGLHLMKLFYYLIFFASSNHLASCYGAWAKHSVFRNYERGTLTDEDVCNPLHRKERLDLSKMANSALIIEPGSMFDTWFNRTYDLHCKFVVKAPKGDLLTANIQVMSFRKNGDKCIDWVKFKRKDRHSTEELCGNFQQKTLSAGKFDYTPSNEDSGVDYSSDSYYGEYDPDAEIETTIYVSKESLKRNEDEKLRLVIAYTPYKSCDKADLDTSIPLLPYNICLSKRYVCDGIANCFEICSDEKNCPIEVGHHGAGSVTIGAVTTILLCFIFFLSGLWICRRYKMLCWSNDCAGPSPHEGRHSSIERHSTNSPNQSIAIAPMLDVAVQSPTLDKDLPPSYDSLFPEQSNPSAT